MIDTFFNDISPYAVIIAVLLLCMYDRAIVKRGEIDIVSISPYPADNGMLRFALQYEVGSAPQWSELRYSLVDRHDPSTMITGKTRSLDFARPGVNSEFLLIREDLVRPGDWDLKVKIVTTAGKLNPLYTLFPIEKIAVQHVVIPGGND
ncbi:MULTISPECIES: hypothetical protein [Shewanella]|uniref:hypothetical protein n=1 Tax=Shewanella TaxID=22 RepID=UPI001AAE4BF7|nr:hypothetical protein [Shewanella algae]MBO2580298.1 hypothetical protein [Shewanella algae]HDS1207884.1 hypothetical protein [Shewanella algae]